MNAVSRSASRAAIRREVAGSPEVQSMNNDCGARPASTPSGPSSSASTSREVGRQVMTTFAPRAASAGETATRAPVSAAKASARAFVRFQTASENGGLAR
jgi:hypothetical protein